MNFFKKGETTEAYYHFNVSNYRLLSHFTRQNFKIDRKHRTEKFYTLKQRYFGIYRRKEALEKNSNAKLKKDIQNYQLLLYITSTTIFRSANIPLSVIKCLENSSEKKSDASLVRITRRRTSSRRLPWLVPREIRAFRELTLAFNPSSTPCRRPAVVKRVKRIFVLPRNLSPPRLIFPAE